LLIHVVSIPPFWKIDGSIIVDSNAIWIATQNEIRKQIRALVNKLTLIVKPINILSISNFNL
jgi:hypothetical protein